VLEPVPDSWEWLDALAGALDADFVSAVREQPEATDRKPISNASWPSSTRGSRAWKKAVRRVA
jgi:hypothetical protein